MRQTELTAQLCSIMRDVRNVRGGTQKKIEKLRQLLSGLLSELTYFEEVIFFFKLLLFFGLPYLLRYESHLAYFSFGFLNITMWMHWFQPIRSPLAPGVLITGIVPSESTIFKSALHPLRLTFRTASGGSCKIIFKKGDDIRQDQLVHFYLFFSMRKIYIIKINCYTFTTSVLSIESSLTYLPIIYPLTFGKLLVTLSLPLRCN